MYVAKSVVIKVIFKAGHNVRDLSVRRERKSQVLVTMKKKKMKENISPEIFKEQREREGTSQRCQPVPKVT